jgi:hypothetical protein
VPTFDELIADKKTYPDDTKVTMADGVEVTLGHLRGGYLKDADYRRKTADLARQREEFDRDRTEREQALQDAETRLQELAKQVVGAHPEKTRDEVADILAQDPVAQRLVARLEQLEGAFKPLAEAVVSLDNRLKQDAMANMVNQHRRALAYLKEKDSELNEEELIRYAKSRQIPRLDDAYRLMKHDDLLAAERKKATEEADKKGYERAKRELSAPQIPVRRLTQSAPDAPKNLDEALDRAVRDEEVVGPLMGFSK